MEASSSSSKKIKLPKRLNLRVREGYLKTLGQPSPTAPTQESSMEDSEGTEPKSTSSSQVSKNMFQQIVEKTRKPPKIQMHLLEKHPKKPQEER